MKLCLYLYKLLKNSKVPEHFLRTKYPGQKNSNVRTELSNKSIMEENMLDCYDGMDRLALILSVLFIKMKTNFIVSDSCFGA